MQKRSWIILSLCVALAGFLVAGYFGSQTSNTPLTQPLAVEMLDAMAAAVEKKSVDGIMKHIAPDAGNQIANMDPDQLRLMLLRAFRSTGKLQATYSNLVFEGQRDEAIAEFDLAIRGQSPNLFSEYPKGHVTLYLRRVEVPRFGGLFRAKEWRIVKAESEIDPSNYGD